MCRCLIGFGLLMVTVGCDVRAVPSDEQLESDWVLLSPSQQAELCALRAALGGDPNTYNALRRDGMSDDDAYRLASMLRLNC